MKTQDLQLINHSYNYISLYIIYILVLMKPMATIKLEYPTQRDQTMTKIYQGKLNSSIIIPRIDRQVFPGGFDDFE